MGESGELESSVLGHGAAQLLHSSLRSGDSFAGGCNPDVCFHVIISRPQLFCLLWKDPPSLSLQEILTDMHICYFFPRLYM